MDPNANLQEQLRLSQEILDGKHVEENAERLAELVQALNGWIKRGGFLPQDWQNR